MNETDLRIDTFTNYGSHQPQPMKITHLPSGLSVQGSDISLIRLKKRLMKELEEKINNTLITAIDTKGKSILPNLKLYYGNNREATLTVDAEGNAKINGVKT